MKEADPTFRLVKTRERAADHRLSLADRRLAIDELIGGGAPGRAQVRDLLADDASLPPELAWAGLRGIVYDDNADALAHLNRYLYQPGLETIARMAWDVSVCRRGLASVGAFFENVPLPSADRAAPIALEPFLLQGANERVATAVRNHLGQRSIDATGWSVLVTPQTDLAVATAPELSLLASNPRLMTDSSLVAGAVTVSIQGEWSRPWLILLRLRAGVGRVGVYDPFGTVCAVGEANVGQPGRVEFAASFIGKRMDWWPRLEGTMSLTRGEATVRVVGALDQRPMRVQTPDGARPWL